MSFGEMGWELKKMRSACLGSWAEALPLPPEVTEREREREREMGVRVLGNRNNRKSGKQTKKIKKPFQFSLFLALLDIWGRHVTKVGWGPVCWTDATLF
jgi:hypothetical protein